MPQGPSHLLILLAAVSLGSTAIANDVFYVFAPDSSNQHVMRLSVTATTESVSIQPLEPFGLSFGPTSTTVNPVNGQLIVTSPGNSQSHAAVMDIQSGGKLRHVGTSVLASPSGYTSVDRTGKFFLTANYPKGIVAAYAIDSSGAIAKQVCAVTTPNKEAHCVLTSPDNQFVYVPCVKNNNALFQYAMDAKTGQLIPLKPFDASPPAMFGPRHVAYHPTLPIAYFSNEQQLGVSVYQINADGQLTGKQHATTMPRRSPFQQGKRDLHASDLVVTADGKMLFVAVRDFNGDEDSVFSFRIDINGKLSQMARTRVGDVPWKLDLSPDGTLLLVSESFDRKLAIFRIQPDGGLTRVADYDWNSEVRDMVVSSPK